LEEEELQSQLMAEGHYKIDEDDASHSCHENIPDTIILESNEKRSKLSTMRKKEKRSKLGTKRSKLSRWTKLST
jgi:hypothetical protein